MVFNRTISDAMLQQIWVDRAIMLDINYGINDNINDLS